MLRPVRALCAATYLSKTPAVERVLLGLRRRLLTKPERRMSGVSVSEKDPIDDETHLAYAARHCSSRRAFAASSSSCETKREPTPTVDIDGIASSMRGALMKMER